MSSISLLRVRGKVAGSDDVGDPKTMSRHFRHACHARPYRCVIHVGIGIEYFEEGDVGEHVDCRLGCIALVNSRRRL